MTYPVPLSCSLRRLVSRFPGKERSDQGNGGQAHDRTDIPTVPTLNSANIVLSMGRSPPLKNATQALFWVVLLIQWTLKPPITEVHR